MRKKALLVLVILLSFTAGNSAAAQTDQAQVTLRIFSGRPDPTWTLSAHETQTLQGILAVLPAGNAAAIPDDLGYRGFQVQLGDQTILVFGGHVQLDARWLVDPSRALETWLLGTAGDALDSNLTVPLWTEFAQVSPEGFAIYLVTGDLTPTQAAQTDVALLQHAAQPIIRMQDITVYHAATHEFELTPAGLASLAALRVPVSGLPFVVCVDKEPIYAGAFWTSYSSLSYYDSVVLDVFPASAGLPLQLALGYPVSSPESFTGQDLRADPRILAAFEQAGKLD